MIGHHGQKVESSRTKGPSGAGTMFLDIYFDCKTNARGWSKPRELTEYSSWKGMFAPYFLTGTMNSTSGF